MHDFHKSPLRVQCNDFQDILEFLNKKKMVL